MKRDLGLLLDEVLENIKLIEESLYKIKKEEFLKNRLLQDATIHRIEIIGEAIKNIPRDIKEKNSEIDWKKIIGARDKMIHHYFGVDLNIVWDIIKIDIFDLRLKILKIKNGLECNRC